MNRDRKFWQKAKGNIFETFAVELTENFTNNNIPTSCNQDVAYALSLQNNRLKNKGLKLQYDFTPRGHFGFSCPLNKSWSDARFVSILDWRSSSLLKKFYRNNKTIYKKKRNCTFYQIITDAKNISIIGDEDYNCPHCGGVSKIKELIDGCPYCGTRFFMDDLYPKVTNYYFIDNIGGNEKEVKGDILKVVIPTIIVSIFGISWYYYNYNPDLQGKIIECIISGFCAGIFGGGILGYLLWVVKIFAKLFIQAFHSIKMIPTLSSRKNFDNQIKQYSPEFSFEYFTSKVISLLKTIMFSDNLQDLPIYVGNQNGAFSPNVVDISYSGALGLENFFVDKGYVYVETLAFLEVWYEENGKIKMKREKYVLVLCKNIMKPIDFNFSIKKIHCNHCGGSFDATKDKYCPYCGTQYSVQDDDWVVLNIKKE